MKTKSFFIAVCAIVALTSCSSYYQIATISSDNARIADNGDFAYDFGEVIIHYDFWSSCGNVSFIVENNTDNDITLDLSNSFFIKNGFAYDYFKNRTDVYTTGSTSGNSRSISSSRSSSQSASVAAAVSAVGALTTAIAVGAGAGASSSTAVTTNIAGSASEMSSSIKSHSIEYKERELVTIPSHSSKKFGEYSMATGEYMTCGLIRNPKGREIGVATYDITNSPIVVENRLYFVIEGQEIPINSVFYVSEFNNYPKKKVIKEHYSENCAGVKSRGISSYVNIQEASNKYYVKYSVSNGDDTGRYKGKQQTQSWR